jgi:hypothetical protein
LEVLHHRLDILASLNLTKYLLYFLGSSRLERVVQILVMNHSLLKQIMFSLRGSRLKFIWKSGILAIPSGCEAHVTAGASSIALYTSF